MDSRPPGKPVSRRLWGTLLSAAITLVVLGFLGRNLVHGWSSVRGFTWRFEPSRLLLSLAILGVYYPLLVWNWCLLLRQLGQPVAYRAALPVWLGSQLGKYLPGKVWTVFGRAYLGERAGLDALRVSLSLLIEVGLIVVTGAVLAAATMPFARSLPIPGRGQFVLLLAPGIAALHPRIFAALVNLGLRILRRGEVRYTCSWRSHGLLVASFLASWVLYGGAFFAFVTSLSTTVALGSLASWSGFVSVLCLHTVSWIVGFLAFLTPGGLGVREASLSFFLASLMPAGAATLVALLARLWITGAELLAIAVGSALGRSPRR